MNQQTGPEAVVFFVRGLTDFAFAADHGDAAAGSGTEECDCKGRVTHGAKIRKETVILCFFETCLSGLGLKGFKEIQDEQQLGLITGIVGI